MGSAVPCGVRSFGIFAALLAAGCNGPANDGETRAARQRYYEAHNGAILGREVCAEVHARPAADALAKKRTLDPLVGYGKLAVPPSAALCVDVSSLGAKAKVVECSAVPKALFDSLALTPMPMPCTPTVAEDDEARRFVETTPRKKEKAAWLARVDDVTTKLTALGKVTTPAKTAAYVVTECMSPWFSGTRYEGRADPTGYKPAGSAAQYDCDLTVFWIDGAGTITAFAHGRGSRATYGAEVETRDTLHAKNSASRRDAIAEASSQLLGEVARRR